MCPKLPLEDVPGSPGMKANPGSYQEDGHKPNLRCFMDGERVCGPDCMAYLTHPPTQQDFRDQPWGYCHLLVNAHRAGKHLVVIAANAERLFKQVDPLDAQRNIPPPAPR